MKITLNGELTEIESKLNISDLLDKFDLDRRKIAVEKNLEIVSQSSFNSTFCEEGDIIEIIHFIGGG